MCKVEGFVLFFASSSSRAFFSIFVFVTVAAFVIFAGVKFADMGLSSRAGRCEKAVINSGDTIFLLLYGAQYYYFSTVSWFIEFTMSHVSRRVLISYFFALAVHFSRHKEVILFWVIYCA